MNQQEHEITWDKHIISKSWFSVYFNGPRIAAPCAANLCNLGRSCSKSCATSGVGSWAAAWAKAAVPRAWDLYPTDPWCICHEVLITHIYIYIFYIYFIYIYIYIFFGGVYVMPYIIFSQGIIPLINSNYFSNPCFIPYFTGSMTHLLSMHPPRSPEHGDERTKLTWVFTSKHMVFL